MSRFRKFFLTVSAVAVIACVSAQAQADTVTIVGVDTGGASTATVTCTLVGDTLTLTVVNTSPSGSTITGIGFDLVAGDFTDNSSAGLNGFAGSQTGATPGGSSSFTFSDGALGNVPHGFNNVVLDFAFITSNNGSFAGGNVGSGISPGESATFSVTSTMFASLGLTEEEICAAIFVRFQNVPTGEGSDVGVPGNPVPEPSSMLLLGSALIGLGGYVRRRLKR